MKQIRDPIQKQVKDVLNELYGYPSFRGEQGEIIESTLAGCHGLILMPTGMGKSLCYQIPSRLLPGLTLVISPLIALMKDQVDACLKRGFRCAYINSSLTRSERLDRYRNLANQHYELLYVTPERFRKGEFLEALSQNDVSLLAIDEAHCISQWGHDFRPDYTRISDFRKLIGDPTTLALTATATPEVQKDIIVQMGLLPEQVKLYNHGLARDNLRISVHSLYGMDSKIRSFVALRNQHPGPAIVYFSLISTLEEFSRQISRLNIKHWTYHGQMGDRDRRQAQELFLESSEGLILATPAFGLGVDKPNIRLVIHAELPGSLEAYYQEIGRSGRDGAPAECVLLYDEDDISIQMDFIKWTNPDPGFISSLFNLLQRNSDRIRSEGLDYLRGQLNFFNRRDFRLETALNLIERWDCVEGSIAQRTLTVVEELPKEFLDPEDYKQRLKSQQEKLLKLVEFAKAEKCRRNLIYQYFGLDVEKPCENCDNCLS